MAGPHLLQQVDPGGPQVRVAQAAAVDGEARPEEVVFSAAGCRDWSGCVLVWGGYWGLGGGVRKGWDGIEGLGEEDEDRYG